MKPPGLKVKTPKGLSSNEGSTLPGPSDNQHPDVFIYIRACNVRVHAYVKKYFSH